MVKHHMKTLCLIVINLTLMQHIASASPNNQSVLRDGGGQIVRGSNANCVRTSWTTDHDPCAAVAVRQTERIAKKADVVQQKYVMRKASELRKEEKTVFFVFNKSSLTPEAKERLNTLASTLKADQSVKEAKIVGFADRIGSNAYNERLSQKRAESVRDYLINSGYTNAQVTETRWVGEQEPSTSCASDKKRPQLIECLQDDRRVEVEIVYHKEPQHIQSN